MIPYGLGSSPENMSKCLTPFTVGSLPLTHRVAMTVMADVIKPELIAAMDHGTEGRLITREFFAKLIGVKGHSPSSEDVER
jgi:hypothetical protein